MRTFLNFNKLTKIILLVVYTALLSLIVVLSINVSDKTNSFKEFTDKPYDDILSVNVNMVEKRASAVENSNNHESTVYDFYLFVTKNEICKVENLYGYLAVKSKNGDIRYHETTSAKTLDNGTYTNGNMYFLNTTSKKIAYKEYAKAENDKEIFYDFTPETIYLKLQYDVTLEGKTTESRELNYQTNISKINTKEFKSYEKREINSDDYIVTGDENFKIRVTQSTDKNDHSKITSKEIKISRLGIANESSLNGKKVKDIDLTIIGEILNKDMVTSGFDEFIHMFTFKGAFSQTRNMTSTRYCDFNIDYNIDKLYFNAIVTYDDNSTKLTQFYIDVKDIK